MIKKEMPKKFRSPTCTTNTYVGSIANQNSLKLERSPLPGPLPKITEINLQGVKGQWRRMLGVKGVLARFGHHKGDHAAHMLR